MNLTTSPSPVPSSAPSIVPNATDITATPTSLPAVSYTNMNFMIAGLMLFVGALLILFWRYTYRRPVRRHIESVDSVSIV